jgi:hypothetical protein
VTVWREDGNLAGHTLAVSQAFVLRMPLPSFETGGVCLDIRCVAYAVSSSEERVIP